jgi:acyl dehydratase
MVQGLLTASAPTKLGGDVDYIAREITFEFVKPVYVGDTVTSEALCTKADSEGGRLNVSFEITCRNQNGQEVLRARTNGIVRL